MKSFGYIFLIICTLNAVTAQNSCLPQGISFAHQYDIDAFQANYPGCTHIEGSVVVFGDDVYNLSGLNVIQSIGGTLRIGDVYWWTNLRNLDGLEGLTYIGGGIVINNNPFLENIEGLSNVECVSDLLIEKNDSLISIAGLEKITNLASLWIKENFSLLSLNGLLNLTSINSNGFICTSNDMLADLSGLENLKKCNGNLEIGNNQSLENLDALYGLNEFGRASVAIYSNAALTNLEGIKNVPGFNISSLTIINNESLTKCHVQSICDRLAYGVGGLNHIQNNGPGCADYIEVKQKCESLGVENDLIQGFRITASPEVDYIVIETDNLNAKYSSAVFDLQGRMLLNQDFKGPIKIINTGFLKAGVYIVSVQVDDQVIVRKVLIK
jgi:hypothetical protein